MFLTLCRYRHILRDLFLKDIKSRYAGSIIGPMWAIITPLYQILLYTFLFSVILKVRFDEMGSSFVVYLLAGLIPWFFFSESVTRGSVAFIENAHLIKKIKCPLEIYIISIIISSLFNFAVYMIVYLIILLFMGQLKLSGLPFTIPVIFTQILFNLGLSFILGSVTVFYRDLMQVVNVVLNVIFYLTPIVYPASMIPETLRCFFRFNPFFYIIEAYRKILIHGLPSFNMLAYPFIVSSVLFFLGYYIIFNKTKGAIKDNL